MAGTKQIRSILANIYLIRSLWINLPNLCELCAQSSPVQLHILLRNCVPRGEPISSGSRAVLEIEFTQNFNLELEDLLNGYHCIAGENFSSKRILVVFFGQFG